MKFLLTALIWLVSFMPTMAQNLAGGAIQGVDATDRSNLWIMWERVLGGADCAVNQDCAGKNQFLSHFIVDIPSSDALDFFQSLEPYATANGSANIAHKKSPICLGGLGSSSLDTPSVAEINALPLAEKIDTLRGLKGVYVDLRAVIGPAGYIGSFGQTAHQYLTVQFARAGIPILVKDDLLMAPGSPELSIRFSPQIQGCRPWSVSLSLKQTLLLSRDLTLKIRGSTWSSSFGQDQTDIDYTVDNAVRDVVKVFIADYLAANDPSYDPLAALK